MLTIQAKHLHALSLLKNRVWNKDLLSCLEHRIYARDYVQRNYFTKIIVVTLSAALQTLIFFFSLRSWLRNKPKSIAQSSKPNLKTVLVSVCCSYLKSQTRHKSTTSLGVTGRPGQERCTFLFGDQHLGQLQSNVTMWLASGSQGESWGSKWAEKKDICQQKRETWLQVNVEQLSSLEASSGLKEAWQPWILTELDSGLQCACWYTKKTRKAQGSTSQNQLRRPAQKVVHRQLVRSATWNKHCSQM